MSRKKGEDNSRLVAVVMAVVIVISVATLIYVSLPHEGNVAQNASQGGGEEKVVLTLTYGNESFNYTLDELMKMDSFTGSGRYIKKSGTIVGPNNYTGVRISMLLKDVPNLPENFIMEAIASDGYTINYTYDEVKGYVAVYNESGNETGVGSLTMIIAYKENGELLGESTGGPLRVAFVDDGAISSSSLWIRSVVALSIRG